MIWLSAFTVCCIQNHALSLLYTYYARGKGIYWFDREIRIMKGNAILSILSKTYLIYQWSVGWAVWGDSHMKCRRSLCLKWQKSFFLRLSLFGYCNHWPIWITTRYRVAHGFKTVDCVLTLKSMPLASYGSIKLADSLKMKVWVEILNQHQMMYPSR